MVKESRKRQRLGAKIHMEYSLLRIIYVSGVKANGTDRDTRGVPWPHVCIRLQSYPTEVGAFRWRTCGPHPNCGSTSPLHSQSPIAPCYLSTRVGESVVRALCARRSFCWAHPRRGPWVGTYVEACTKLNGAQLPILPNPLMCVGHVCGVHDQHTGLLESEDEKAYIWKNGGPESVR